MVTNKIKLSDFSKVKEFNADIMTFDGDVDLKHGRHVVDARSLMGIYSLDLSNVLDAILYSEDQAVIDRFTEICKKYE